MLTAAWRVVIHYCVSVAERGERARQAIEDRLVQLSGQGYGTVSVEPMPTIGDDPAGWTVVADDLLNSGIHELGRPTLEAIAVLMRFALAETSPNHPDRERFVRFYGAAQTAIVATYDDLDVIAETVAVLTAVIDKTGGGPVRHLAAFGLAVMAEMRTKVAPSAAAAGELASARRRLLDETDDRHPHKPEFMADLGWALIDAFRLDPDEHELVDEATAWTRRALLLAGDRHPKKGHLLRAAGAAQRAKYDTSGDASALAEALRLARAAILAAGEQVPWSWRAELAERCRAEFELHQVPGVLHEEIRELRTCLTTMPGQGAAAARVRAGLANALRKRYQADGRREDLAQAIDLMRTAETELVAHPSERCTVLGNLSATLTLLYELTEDEDVRNESIRVGREATALGEAGSTELLRGWNNLAISAMRRYWLSGDSRALQEAVQLAEAALAATPEPGADRAGRLNNLGSAIFMLFMHTGDREHLERSIDLNREALAMLPDRHELRAGLLNELGARLRQRFLRFDDDLGTITEAVDVLAEAVSLVGPNAPDRFHFRTNYSGTLHSLYRADRQEATLDKAIYLARETLAASPPGFADRASLLTACAAPLGSRYYDFGDVAAGKLARAYFLAAAQAPDPPERQIGAARQAAELSITDEQWDGAAIALSHAVTLLPRLASRRLARSDQERQLGTFAGMVRDASAYAVRAGFPERAAATLEQGRGVLLAQALENRDDFAAVRKRDRNLAEELAACRDAMNHGSAGDQGHDRHHELASRWDRLVAKARALPGLDRFQLPPRFDDLRRQAGAGPIVVVNVSDVRSDALVLTADGLRVAELPGVHAKEVERRVRIFLAAVDSPTGAGTVAETLGWLWDAVAGPVLDLLEISGPPATGSPWPRLWWCPTGPLALLPLHAAGHHTAGGSRAVIDRVVSSYTPTIRALEHARNPTTGDAASRPGAALAVAVPRAPGARELPGALDELAVLRNRLPHPPEEMTGAQAGRDAVLAALPAHPWAHFACHAFSDLDNPSAGQLLVHDHDTNPLTVGQVGRLTLHDAEFAYLSACSTGRSSMRLADEAIHLASAFQLAGYRQVVATLWPITDRHAVRLADWIYAGIAANGVGSAALAVHQATRQLRQRWPDHPTLWAAHIHAGA